LTHSITYGIFNKNTVFLHEKACKPVSLDEAIKTLERSRGKMRFRALLAICAGFFGEARIRGSHHIFTMPWPGDPRINLQAEGSEAKPYQVQQVLRALKKLQAGGG
jgi:hypothetical protein